MTAKAYNAGTIFLQVVPVFGDTMNAIRREAKDANKALGDEMEKGGRDAGKRASKAIGEELNKGAKEQGKDAGEKYAGEFRKTLKEGVEKLQREVAPIKMNVERNELRREFAEIKAEIKALSGDVKVGIDAKSAEARLSEIGARLRTLQDQAKNIEVKTNLDEATKGVDRFIARIEKAKPTIEVDADFKQADRAMGAFEKKMKASAKRAADALGDSVNAEARKISARLAAIGDMEIGIDIQSADAMREILSIESALGALSAQKVDIGVDVDILAALGELEAFAAAVDAVDRDDVNIDVDLKGWARAMAGLAALRGRVNGLANDGMNSANSFRAFSFIILGLATLLPALIPMIAALGGALLALGPILAGVGAGVGVMILGFSGIGDAVGALGDVSKNAAKDSAQAARTMASAARSVADARRNLARTEADSARSIADARRNLARAEKDAARSIADARRNLAETIASTNRANEEAARAVADAEERAADTIESALDRRRDAVESLADAQRDATKAEKDLAEARKDAQQELIDLQDELTANQLAEDQAVLDLFDATVFDTATRQDGAATNYDKEQSRINLETAQLRLKNIREEREALLAKQQAGVDGSERVQTAEERVADALERQQEAQENLAEASQEVADARVKAAEMVADALREQDRTEADGRRAVAEAQEAASRAIADAHRSVADAARAARRTEADAARSVADAQRALRRAQQDYQDALVQTGELGSASMQKLNDAMSKLSPAGRKFAIWLHSLRDEFYGIRAAAQEGMLPGVQAGMETIFGHYGPRFKSFIGEMGTVIGDLFRRFGKLMTSPVWEDFFGMLAELGPKFMRQFGKTTMNWMTVFARLLTIAAPWAEKFSTALLHLSEHALDFVTSAKGTKFFEDFMGYVEKVGPKVWEFFKNLWNALVNLGIALAPLGALVLGVVDAFLGWIANMDPKVLGMVVTAIITLVIAFQLMNGVVFLLTVGIGLLNIVLAGGILGIAALVVGAVVLIVGALVILYTQSETARNIINAALGAIGDAAMWLWDKAIKPAFGFIWDLVKTVFKAIAWTWENVLWPVLKAIAKVVGWLWTNAVKPAFDAIWTIIVTVFKAIRWNWENILWPVLDLIITAFWKTLWLLAIKPALERIGAAWDVMSGLVRAGWKDYIKPALENAGEAIGVLHAAFDVAITAIGELWRGLQDVLAAPVRFLIDTIINEGIIGSFNRIADFVGSKRMGLVPLPNFAKEHSPASNPGKGGMDVGAATGGVLPGWSPGGDIHHFESPTGGRLHLSGGEAVMRPEFTATVGPGWVEKVNEMARRFGPRGVRKAMGFAKGGVIWPTTFKSLSEDYPGHTGVDISIPGTADLGKPVFATAPGMARAYWAGSDSYGNLVRIDHGGYETLYGHLMAPGYSGPVKAGQQIGNIGSTGNSTGPHLHFEVRPGGTRAAALAYLGGSSTPTGGDDSSVFSKIAGWAKKAIKAPVSWLTEKVSESFAALTGSPFGSLLVGVGKKVLGGVADFITNPGGGDNDSGGGDNDSGGGATPEAGFSMGGVYSSSKFKNNGTMMYDNGGMLPPGLTTVLNLTGKPEPVFTDEQWGNVAREGGGGIHYEPHFEGSDLTAADVADDLEFAFRKLDRAGKYGR